MDTTLNQKSLDVQPLLAKLKDTHSLYALARDTDNASRTELTNVMVDLLQLDLKRHERELLADVVMSLIQQAEHDLRTALAERLSLLQDVPLSIILFLANDEIQVAQKVLEQSPILDDMDLVYLIKSKGSDHWQAIARRNSLSIHVINTLAETRDEATAITLSENGSVILTDIAISIFVEMAKQSDALAKPLLMRDELPGIVGNVLYDYVGEAIKDLIKERFPLDQEFVNAQLDDIVQELCDISIAGESDYVPAIQPGENVRAMAEQASNTKIINLKSLMKPLKRGQLQTFTGMMAAYCNLPLATTQEIMLQDSGQGLAIIAKAMDIQKADFIAMYLSIQRIRHKGQRIIHQDEFAKVGAYYDKIDRDIAQIILNESRH